MGSTISEMTTKISNAIKLYPINPDAGFAARMTARATEAFNQVVGLFAWKFTRDGWTLPATVMPDEFEQLYFALAMWGACMDYNLMETAQSHWGVYVALVAQARDVNVRPGGQG